MVTPKEIEAFKRAFKRTASDKKWKPRWEDPTGCFAFLKSKTRLAAVVKAMDKFKAEPDLEHLKQVRETIDGLDKGVWEVKTYKEALDELNKSLDSCVMKQETVGGVKYATHGDGSVTILGPEDKEIVKLPKMYMDAGYGDTLKDLITRLDGIGKGEEEMPPIVGIDKVIKSVVKSIELAAPAIGTNGSIDGTIWEEAIDRLSDTVMPRVKDDLERMKSSGLVPEGYSLKGLELSGSDFHKGGHQVIFLHFEDDEGHEKKVVYKPSNLEVDKLLFGTEGLGSILDDSISTYKIETRTDDDDHDYGYLEFVDVGDGPTTPENVRDIFVGLAANMALSAYVGLEDVHQENVLMLSDSVQVIDMEATTGLFKMGEDVTAKSGGFLSQLWGKCLKEGIRAKLQKQIEAKKLTTIPDTDVVWRAMLDKFKKVLNSMSDGGNEKKLKEIEKSLAEKTARFVPIETNIFQTTIINKAKSYESLQDWRKMLDDQEAGGPLLRQAKGTLTVDDAVIRRLLYTRGVYNALRKGDVPYYVKELGSKVVRDEAGEAIDADGHPKIGGSISEAMATRRNSDTHARIIEIFEMQIGGKDGELNSVLTDCRKMLT